VLVAALLLATACGGSSSPKPSAASTGTNSQSSQQTSSSSDSSSTSGSSSSDAGAAPQIFDANYQQGSAHVEISGGANRTVDLTKAGGYTVSGATVVTFTDAQSQNALSVTSSKSSGDASGITLTAGGISTAGEFGRDCQLTVTKNDASEFAGKIQCTNVDGIEGSTVHSGLNVNGTFSAKP
jgi:hypothetical protein